MSLTRKFTEHPATVGETYGQHFFASTGFGLALLRAAFYCGVHAILPFVFEKAGSESITRIYDRMVAERGRREKDRGLNTKTA